MSTTHEPTPDDQPIVEEFFPARDRTRTDITAPVARVTLLEDRAQVTRRAALTLASGTHRLVVPAVAPVIQNVSVRAKLTDDAHGQVTDAAVRRAMRVRTQDAPDELKEIDAKRRELRRGFTDLKHARERAEQRHATVADMIVKGAIELPEDASWGIVDPEGWRASFGELFERAAQMQQAAIDAAFAQRDLIEELTHVVARRHILERPDQHFIAWIEVDVVVADQVDGPVTLEIEYVVPNALWRPIHRARLTDGTLAFTARAAVWQNTGEDWKDAELVFSTARSSLGHEPPYLADDLLSAQRKPEDVKLEAREVEVQSASVGGPKGGAAPSQPATVDLPGVDDGGDIQTLSPDGARTIPSDGRPYFVDLFTFTEDADIELVLMPEVQERVVIKATATHSGKAPVLAGPVELIRNGGSVGWTQTLFIAPTQVFELGFGTQEDVHVVRQTRSPKAKVDAVDKWTRQRHNVSLFLSNVGDTERVVSITERIPVSEVEHVRIKLDDAKSKPVPALDEHGFCTWTATLEPYGHETVKLVWEMATAPQVQGL